MAEFPRGVSPALWNRGCAGLGCRGNSCCHCNRLETWEGQSRSLKSTQGCEAPTSQELLIPNPLDLILLWAVIVCCLWLGSGALCSLLRNRQHPGCLQNPQRMSLPPPPEATPARREAQWAPAGFRVSRILPGSASCPASLSRAELKWSRGVSPGGSLGALQHHPCCPSHRGGSRVEICQERTLLIPAGPSRAWVSCRKSFACPLESWNCFVGVLQRGTPLKPVQIIFWCCIFQLLVFSGWGGRSGEHGVESFQKLSEHCCLTGHECPFPPWLVPQGYMWLCCLSVA